VAELNRLYWPNFPLLVKWCVSKILTLKYNWAESVWLKERYRVEIIHILLCKLISLIIVPTSIFINKSFKEFTIEKPGETKGVIRIRRSKKDRHHNVQKKKDKQRSTKHTHKTNTNPIKKRVVNSGAPEG